MKKAFCVAIAAACLSCFAPGASAIDIEVGGRVLAGGGTPVSNGVFFPGTALPNNDGSVDAVLPPVQIKQGTNFEFTNLDEATVGNGHKLVSLKRKKGRPVFSSDLLSRPGTSTLVATSNLPPGIYPFFCTVHTGMWGQIEIVR